MKVFSDKQINSIKRDLQFWLGDEYAISFDRSKDKAKWFLANQDALLTNDQFVKKYDIDALISVDTKPMESLYNRYPNFDKLTENQIKRFTNSTDISKDELKKFYDFENKSKARNAKYNEERYKELDKDRQEAERANDSSYYTSPLANEYARKAYIQGDLDKAKWHEAAGKIAGAADFAPFPISLAGPMIRQYQRYDIGEEKPSYIPSTETLFDYGSSVIPDIAERPAKLGLRFAKGALEKVLNKAGDTKLFKQLENIAKAKDAERAAKAAVRDKALIDELGDMNKFSTEELLKFANSTDNPTIKNEIYKFIDARHSGQPLPTSIDLQMKELPSIELKANQAEVPLFKNGSVDLRYQPVNASQLAEYQALQDRGGRIANLLETGLNLGTRKFARSGIRGDIAPSTWYEYKPDYNKDKAVDEVIKMYSNDWKYGRPSNYNEPLIKEAYDKWLNDQYMKGNYDVLYRMGEI